MGGGVDRRPGAQSLTSQTQQRIAGLTNPATDPLLSAGAAKDIPLDVH